MIESSRRFSRLAPRAVLAALLAARAACAAADGGREEVTRSFQKALPLKAGQKLSVEHTNGAVRVHARAESQVSIDARIRVSARDRAEAEKFSSAIEIQVEASAAGSRCARATRRSTPVSSGTSPTRWTTRSRCPRRPGSPCATASATSRSKG